MDNPLGTVPVAHSPPEGHKGAAWHALKQHLEGTAQLAGQFAGAFGAGRAAALAGLVHDLGKYAPAFQRYIRGAGPSQEHAIIGAAWLWNEAGKNADGLIARLLAHAVAGHHAGLHNTVDELKVRIENSEALSAKYWTHEIAPEPHGLLPDRFQFESKKLAAFQLAFLGRMLFSALVDADYKDTEAYYARIEARQVDRDWPKLPAILPDLIHRFDAHMARLSGSSKAATEPLHDVVQTLRRDVLAHVRAKASEAPGCFTLTVPTGGGKTLTSLGFALDHARAHGLRRIIYAIPFTSVIDQTADIFREVLGEDVILEHHSAIEEEKADKAAREARDKLRLAMEDWAAPIIVTTHVQLFESLFSHRPSRCRKLHALSRSVIVLDEAQTLPLGLLHPCTAALRELARAYGTSVVLCTATQPALDEGHFRPLKPGTNVREPPWMGLKLAGRELAPEPGSLAERLRRVTFRRAGPMDNDQLIAALAAVPQGLVIVNTRAHALALYQHGRSQGLEGLVHLSTRQCAAHRRLLLGQVRDALKHEQPCRLVATSLIEAGVDVDFPRLWRAEAGLEQIVQAAGRCNREGRRPPEESIVTLFTGAGNDAKAPNELKRNAEVFAAIEEQFPDWSAPEAVERYFRELYWTVGKQALDQKEVMSAFQMDHKELALQFDYRRIGEDFKMIKDWGEPVIIPDAANAETIAKLDISAVPSGALARALQPWIVQVPSRDRERLIRDGMVRFAGGAERADQFAVLCNPDLYSLDSGLIWEGGTSFSACW